MTASTPAPEDPGLKCIRLVKEAMTHTPEGMRVINTGGIRHALSFYKLEMDADPARETRDMMRERALLNGLDPRFLDIGHAWAYPSKLEAFIYGRASMDPITKHANAMLAHQVFVWCAQCIVTICTERPMEIFRHRNELIEVMNLVEAIYRDYMDE